MIWKNRRQPPSSRRAAAVRGGGEVGGNRIPGFKLSDFTIREKISRVQRILHHQLPRLRTSTRGKYP